MSNKFDNLDETFNVEETMKPTVEVESVEVESSIDKFEKVSEDIRKDYEYSRGNLYSIIEKGQEALNGVIELAQETEMPRAYEVAGQLIKSVSDATEKLIDLQKKLKDIQSDDKKKGPTSVTNNALFIGSTAELSKLLKQQKEDENV
jgi:hypothetical protein